MLQSWPPKHLKRFCIAVMGRAGGAAWDSDSACHAQGLLERDVGKRLSAAAALESPWVREGGCAPDTPLEGTVVQRLQRHATYGHLKQLVRRPAAAAAAASSCRL